MCRRNTSPLSSGSSLLSAKASPSPRQKKVSDVDGTRPYAAKSIPFPSCGTELTVSDVSQDDSSQIKVLFTSEFKRNVRRLAKRYRRIRLDLLPTFDQLAAGKTPGDRVKGVSHVVYKVRVANSDASRGKSGGYRVVYYVQAADRVVLLTVYSKSDQADVSTKWLRQFIADEAPDL